MDNYPVAFQLAIAKTLGHEGGYSNRADDPGGETNWGIAKRYHPNLDIKNLTRDEAIDIYFQEYWSPMRLGELRDQRLVEKVFDSVVNQDWRVGPGALQGALVILGQNITLDYKVGPATIAAANSYPDPETLLEVFIILRGMAYLVGAENIEEVRAMIRARKDRLRSNRGWWARLELGAIVALLFIGSGCSILGGKGFEPPVLEAYSDAGVEKLAKKLQVQWGTRGTKARAADVGGNVVLSATSSALTIASTSGARPGILALVGSVFSSAAQAFGILDAPAIANAYSSGALMIGDSQADYADCKAVKSAQPKESEAISDCGAKFLRGINDANHVVSRMILGIPADKDVLARLVAATQKVRDDAIARAAAEAAVKATKLTAPEAQ